MKLPIYPIDAFTGRLFGGLLGGAVTTNVAYADALTKAERDKMTPDQVLALMKKAPA